MSTESPGDEANAGTGLKHESATDTSNGPGDRIGIENTESIGSESSEARRIFSAPKLLEAHPPGSPQSDDRRSGHQDMAPPVRTTSPVQVSSNDDYHGNFSDYRRESWSSSASPRWEKGPPSSASSPAHTATPGPSTAETTATRYGIDTFSPTNISQSVFSVNDGSEEPLSCGN
ncbi:hypothetical protein VPNG_05402 [Cytospora leucostoma]|uniref:Uncharacterized protein n=1 Tax=Cytospora leucostoma TaxID=1230097 RepID=A0A423X4N6_9PEZI|nr:hypothetical protein VPNG_05402 [Cytospora leucostoma]